MKLSDLFVDAGEPDRLSHTKLWANIAYAASTVAFVYQAYKGTLDSDVWALYLGIVGAHSTASKFLSLKFRQPRQMPVGSPYGPQPQYNDAPYTPPPI